MRGRPFEVEWGEDAEALGQLYRRETDPELRPRLHALWLLRGGRRLVEVAGIVGVHYSTLQQWVAWYRAGGADEVRRHRRGGRQGKAAYLSPEQERAVVEEAKTGAFRTAGELGEWIERQYGVAYRPGSLYSLAERLKLSKKVPRPVNEKSDEPTQEAWKKGG